MTLNFWRNLKITCRFTILRHILLIGSVLFLYSCSKKEDTILKFGVFKDENTSPELAWKIADTLSRDRKIFNPGITGDLWWLATSLSNSTDSSKTFFLLPNNPHINQIEVYTNHSSTPAMVLGDFEPFSQRPFRDRDLIIPLTLPPFSSIQLLMKLDKVGETFHIEPEILEYESFHNRRTLDTLIIGFFLGWMGIVFIFAIFFSLELKAWSGAIYAAYVLSISLWLATHWGITFQYLWPERVEWVGLARPFFNILTNMLIVLLVVRFFPPKTTGKNTAKLIWFTLAIQFIILLLFFFPLGFLEESKAKMVSLQITLFFSLLSSFLILYYPFLQWRAKVPLAGYYLVGISFLALFNIVIQLNQKVLPMGLPHYLLNFGSAFCLMGETALITAAFARRASVFKKEKEKLSIQILEKEKELANQLIQVQEDERQRLGRDLHDSIGGMLASLYIETETISEKFPEAPMEHLKQMIEQSIQEARSLSHNLTPHHLEEFGLENVLKGQIDLLRKKYPLDFSFYYKINSPIPKSLQLILYRIANELLLNIVKHANANEALLSISEIEGEIELIAEDNGKGFGLGSSSAGIGLKNLQERVNYLKGTMTLESNTSGTTLSINIPTHVEP